MSPKKPKVKPLSFLDPNNCRSSSTHKVYPEVPAHPVECSDSEPAIPTKFCKAANQILRTMSQGKSHTQPKIENQQPPALCVALGSTLAAAMAAVAKPQRERKRNSFHTRQPDDVIPISSFGHSQGSQWMDRRVWNF